MVLFHSNGQASVSFKLKFKDLFWRSMLPLQLAMENGTLLGSPGVMDEATCQSDIHKCKLAGHFLWILFSYFVLNEL